MQRTPFQILPDDRTGFPRAYGEVPYPIWDESHRLLQVVLSHRMDPDTAARFLSPLLVKAERLAVLEARLAKECA